MKKIISLFQRNYDGDRLVRNEVVPGAEWVLAGEGVATRKYDGACCMVTDGTFYRRFELKKGRTAPARFIPAQDPDPVTGDQPGWVPVGYGPEDQWFREAHSHFHGTFGRVPDGTYEAIGPHFQKNPEGLGFDGLVRHGFHVLVDVPRSFDALKAYFAEHEMEGIVWHHPDGRMVKIKAKDFGIRRSKHVHA